jgi:DNA-binding transcriptional MerR regulator
MPNLDTPALSIGEVAQRTSISPSTLRMWETRYGFPAPDRSDGRHRRYTEEDCRLLLEVRRARETGVSMATAIEQGRHAVRHAENSIYGGLLLRHPESEVVVLPEPFMLAISRALEDTMIERPGGILFGAFQRQAAWHLAEPRWQRAAQHAHAAAVFADFPAPERRGALWCVPFAPGSRLASEWTVVLDGPNATGCIVGRELDPEPAPLGRRRFETVWSLDPVVVRDVARVATTIAATTAPQLAEQVALRLRTEPRSLPATMRDASTFVNRIFVHLEALAGGRVPRRP